MIAQPDGHDMRTAQKPQLFLLKNLLRRLYSPALCPLGKRGEKHVTAAEGIIDKDVDLSIRNLTSIGKEAMCSTDEMVLNIMTHKSC
jgi:hypothetical protein